jgi:phosphatidylglycerophosphate synthase
MMANLITLLRVIIAFLSLYLLPLGPSLNLIGMIFITASMLLDILDGAVARYLKTTSLTGSVYDILGDRIIENTFFIYFASLSCFSVWFALIIMLRGLTMDAVRTIFASQGKMAFGKDTWHTRKWVKWLTGTRLSRGAYNAFKLLTFVSFAALLAPNSIVFHFLPLIKVEYVAHLSLWLTVILALIRCLPVLLDAWFLSHKGSL